jgi:hypothetical protein
VRSSLKPDAIIGLPPIKILKKRFIFLPQASFPRQNKKRTPRWVFKKSPFSVDGMNI